MLPGFFRTNIFLDSHLKVEIDPLDADAKLNNQMVTLAGQLHGKQPGDPRARHGLEGYRWGQMRLLVSKGSVKRP